MSFRKEGYIEQWLCPVESPSEGLSIVLTPQPELTGQVLDETGEPVRRFEVFAESGKDPASWECSSENVDDPLGRFTIRIGEAGPVWVGVKAPGYALSEKRTDTNQPLDPLVFTLDRGYMVRATAIRPKNVGQPLKARLVPAFTARIPFGGDQMTQRQIAGVIDTTVGDDGRLELNHVAQGSYVLFVYGPGVTPVKQWVGILEDNQELGEIRLRGTGTVFGQAYRPREEGSNAWAFANGVIGYEGCSSTYPDPWEFSPLGPISFTADENGRFRVDGVPVGRASVSIPYSITADIIGAYVRNAIVLENTSTEVRFFVPDTDWGLPLNVTVGDGSEANWRSASLVPATDPSDEFSGDCLWAKLYLTPLSSMTVSYPAAEECDLAQNATIMLPDVQPGRYRLTIDLGWRRGPCWASEIDVKSRAEPVTISLGAGSVCGRLEWSGKSRHDVQLWLTRGEDRANIRTVSCDESGHFAFRFVSPGAYSLQAHDHEAGWCRIGPITVGSGRLDVGVHRLQRGGEISGTVVGVMGKEPPDNILATASNGVSIDVSSSYFVGYHGEPFVFRNLWPDEWTVELRVGDTVLASGKVTLTGTEKATVDFAPE